MIETMGELWGYEVQSKLGAGDTMKIQDVSDVMDENMERGFGMCESRCLI